MFIKIEKKHICETKVKKNVHHLEYIYICVCVCVCVCIKEYNVCKKWSQDQGTCNEKYIKTSLHPSKTLKATLPLSSMSYASSPPSTYTTVIYKTTPLFCHE